MQTLTLWENWIQYTLDILCYCYQKTHTRSHRAYVTRGGGGGGGGSAGQSSTEILHLWLLCCLHYYVILDRDISIVYISLYGTLRLTKQHCFIQWFVSRCHNSEPAGGQERSSLISAHTALPSWQHQRLPAYKTANITQGHRPPKQEGRTEVFKVMAVIV